MGFGARVGAIVLALLGLGVVAPQMAQASVVQVNTPADSSSGCPASCSIRDALTVANNGDTIDVPGGTYTLTIGELSVAKSVTITGAGAGAVMIVGQSDRVMLIQAPSVLTMSGVTITGGGIDGDGGGILNDGTLNLRDSVVNGNHALALGGGIYSDGTLTVSNSSINGNTGDAGGGGIDNAAGSMTISDSTIAGNKSTGGSSGGGGISNGGSMTISNSTINGNDAALNGAGISDTSGSADAITNSTITGNTVTALSSGNQGGGIYDDNQSGGLTGINDTIAGNSAIEGSNVFFNDLTAGGFQNTIIAKPLGAGTNCGTSGLIPTSLGHNLEDDAGASCNFAPATDKVGVHPKLGALANNGGPTETMALLTGSPAINAAAPVKAISRDQRGAPRPQPSGGAPDIGAYEYGALVDLGIQATAPHPATVGHILTYTLKVANHGPGSDSALGVQVVDNLPSSVKFASATPSKAGSCSSETSGQVTCTLTSIAHGATENVAVRVLPQRPGFPVNHSAVSSGALDPNSKNNKTALTVVVQDRPAVLTRGTDPLAYRDATVHATVRPNNAKTTYYFEYGPTTSYGSKTGSHTTSGLSSLSVALPVNGLHPGRLYHYRIVAVNAAGMTEGTDHTFFTFFLPALHVSPSRVRPGHRLHVYGNAGECPVGDTVTLLSSAFSNAHTYRGQGAIYTAVHHHGFFSTITRVPSDRQPGTYPVSGLCGRFPAAGAGDGTMAATFGLGPPVGPRAVWSGRLRVS